MTGAAVSYRISGGDDSAQFSINSSSGVVSFVSSPDFENPTDAGSGNGYDIVIQATESGNTFVTTRSVTVTVSNVLETAPRITSGGSASFAENGTGAVYTVRGFGLRRRRQHQLQHQWRCRLGPVQHQQQQWCGELQEQPRL